MRLVSYFSSSCCAWNTKSSLGISERKAKLGDQNLLLIGLLLAADALNFNAFHVKLNVDGIVLRLHEHVNAGEHAVDESVVLLNELLVDS
jgi:hypothetical protein